MQGVDLAEYNGAEVWVHFDPFAFPVRATVTLAQRFADTPEGTVVATCLEPSNAAPELIRTRENTFQIIRHDGAMATRRARMGLAARVRRETRALDLDNRRMIGITEISGPAADADDVAMPEPVADPADTWTPGDAIKTGIARTIKTSEELLEAAAS